MSAALLCFDCVCRSTVTSEPVRVAVRGTMLSSRRVSFPCLCVLVHCGVQATFASGRTLQKDQPDTRHPQEGHEIHEATGLPMMWWPTPENPLPVHKAFDFYQTGNGGINNILYANIRAAHLGCKAAREDLDARNSSDPAASLSFAIVIMPPLRTELGYSQKVPMHMYSDLFDLEHQARNYMHYRNCFITDRRMYELMVAEGALQLSADMEVEKRDRPRGIYTGREQHKFYQGLEMSPSLRERFYEPCVTKMRRVFHYGESQYTAVHMRIEDDWSDYCQRNEAKQKSKVPEGEKYERYCFGVEEIANITLSTPALTNHHNFLLLYADDNFHPDWPKRPDSMKADPMKVWPADAAVANPVNLHCFTDEDGHLGNSTYTERSVVSMFLAADADAFVGQTRSTLFLGTSMIRALSRPYSQPSFAYDGDREQYKIAHEWRPSLRGWKEDPARRRAQL